ncbi:zinc-binding dehydrogenase [Pseudonocardia alni]|uniref:zinc-binding dehydrogenase n=1 Tax=Pseudonocardia alni TaxID=33907 RepID=UPI003F688589
MIDQLGLPPGARLLVNGIGGGVGIATAQLARARGLRVVGTAGGAKRADLMVQGVLDPHITAVHTLDEAAQALAGVENGHATGKTVLDLTG